MYAKSHISILSDVSQIVNCGWCNWPLMPLRLQEIEANSLKHMHLHLTPKTFITLVSLTLFWNLNGIMIWIENRSIHQFLCNCTVEMLEKAWDLVTQICDFIRVHLDNVKSNGNHFTILLLFYVWELSKCTHDMVNCQVVCIVCDKLATH